MREVGGGAGGGGVASVVVLQIRLAVEGCREGHVVEGARLAAGVRLHALDAVLGLVGRQLAAQLVGQDVRLVAGQDAERVDDLSPQKPNAPVSVDSIPDARGRHPGWVTTPESQTTGTPSARGGS